MFYLSFKAGETAPIFTLIIKDPVSLNENLAGELHPPVC
jgi:hypothetical protein